MTDSDVPATEELRDFTPEEVPAPKNNRYARKMAARSAARSTELAPPHVVSLAALRSGDEDTVDTVSEALRTLGFWDGLPDGDTLQKSYARLQRYLGYGRRPDGVPDSGSLTWLALRTQAFTITD